MSLVASSHFSMTNRLLSSVVNHWEISPLMKVLDGTPINITDGIDNSLTDQGQDRPNLTGSKVLTGAKIRSGSASNASYLSKAGFADSPVGTFGSLGRNAFRGPKYFQLDSALVRSFPVYERFQMMLRLEAFNVLNHPNFSTPGTSLTSSTFGDVTSMNSYGPRIFQGAIKFSF